jgi:hypothetical protein
MEVARVERHGNALTGERTQLGAVYEVRYRLESELLSVELVGERMREVRLGDADFFDLGYSPLFNSLSGSTFRRLRFSAPSSVTSIWGRVSSATGREPSQPT